MDNRKLKDLNSINREIKKEFLSSRFEKKKTVKNVLCDLPITSQTREVGGANQEIIDSPSTNFIQELGKNIEFSLPPNGEGTVKQAYDKRNIFNVNESRPYIDDTKLIISLHVDRFKCSTHEELYYKIKEWWVKTKGRSLETVESRITYARSMAKHQVYPVDWLKFEPEQIINQLLYRQIYEYKELAKQTGNPTYGATQLHNLQKTVHMFAEAYGMDISYWGWSPPTPPMPQIKVVPRPKIVNQLMHHWYTNNRFENALIRTVLTVGFHTGIRPEELIIIKASDVHFDDGYIFIREQKKKFRERQVWVDDIIMNSRQQNSLRNWVQIWRPRKANDESGDFLFIKEKGSPFSSTKKFRAYLAPFCKPVWNDFKPKIMRDWSAIARLIRTKIETDKWDIRTVRNDLGQSSEQTTEFYVRFAENYYRRDPYDWLRSVLKFHPNSDRMKQYYGSTKKTIKILTNEKKGSIEVRVPPVRVNGPMGVNDCVPLLEILTNSHIYSLLVRFHYSLKSFFFSFFVIVKNRVSAITGRSAVEAVVLLAHEILGGHGKTQGPAVFVTSSRVSPQRHLFTFAGGEL